MRNLIIIILTVIPNLLCAQKKEYKRFETRPIHENYIIDYSDQLSIKIYGILKSNKIAHVNYETEQKIEYKPNENFNIGFGLGYKWFGLDLAFNLSGVNNDDDIYGHTKRFDIQSNIYTRQFAIDIHWQKYRGYYGSNPEDYRTSFDPDNPYPIRPDIRTVNYRLSALYIFKHDKFSYRSAFTYNERQIKGTGSFLAGPFFNYYRMDADSTLIPLEAQSDFDSEYDFRGSEYINFGLAGGYAHNFVIGKRVFFSITMALGLGPEIKKTPALDGREASNKSKFVGQAVIRAAMGYNSEKFYAGLSSVGVYSGEREEEDYLERGVSHLKIFIGKRFNPPKFLLPKKK
ncbi:MAG: DUF4421 domain-containing protein [Reichenbachiella sp.]|uniref:DUF4421 domain-containing protein n=1 Tax=Reichenbachiella sp. TaxID=2184521 RepID=UPI0032999205